MNQLNHFNHHAHWFLRIALASVFIFHGALKFSNLEGFTEMLPISYIETVLVALAELVGGLLIVAGGFSHQWQADLATRIGAAMQIPVMIGAIAMIHWGRWNFVPTPDFPMGGMQFQVTLALLAIYFVINGNGTHRDKPIAV
ncbi:MAG: DoxX family protein [Candidatus Thiodiazotropha sp. DIVDIV]